MDSGVHRQSGVKRPRTGTPAASSSTAMPPPKPKPRQHDRTPPETGTVAADKLFGSREIGEVYSARRSALPAISSTLLRGASSYRYGDGSGTALRHDHGGSEGARGRASVGKEDQRQQQNHVESSAAATASNNNGSRNNSKADSASGAGAAVASRSLAALTVSRMLQLEHGATESKTCKRQQAGSTSTVGASSIGGSSSMADWGRGCGQGAATIAENGEGAADAEVGGGDGEAAWNVAIGVLSFESLREGDVAVSSLFLKDDTGRVRLTCVPPPPPSWLGKVVCLSRWTLARDKRSVGAPRQRNVPGGIEIRSSTPRASSSPAPSSPLTRMACFTAYLEVTEMILLVRGQACEGSGISGGGKRDSKNGGFDFGSSDGGNGIGKPTGRMLSDAERQARDREERWRQQAGGGTAAAGGGRGGGGDESGEKSRCEWSCVHPTDVRRPTLSTVTSQGALGLDAFVDRKGRGPLDVVARVAAVSPIVRFKNAPPFFMVEVEQAEPQLDGQEPRQQQQQQQRQKEQEDEARQTTDLQGPHLQQHQQHQRLDQRQQLQQLQQQQHRANERQHQSREAMHNPDSESSLPSALLSPSEAETSPPSAPASPPFSSPLPTTQEICRSPEEISALFPIPGSRDDDRAGRPPPISFTASSRQQRSPQVMAPAAVVEPLGGDGSGSHAAPEKRRGTTAGGDASRVDSVGGGSGGSGGDDAGADKLAGEKGDPGIGGEANSSNSQRQRQPSHRHQQQPEVQETNGQQAHQQLTAMLVLNGRRCLPWQAFLVPGKTFVFPQVGAFVLGGKSRSSSSGGKQSTTYRAFGDAGGKGGGAGASGLERHLVEVDARGLDTRSGGGSTRDVEDGDLHHHSPAPPNTTSKPSLPLADGSPLATEGPAQPAVGAAGVGRIEGRTAGDRGRLRVGPVCDGCCHSSVDGGEGVGGEPACQRGRRCNSGCGCCVITYEGQVTALAGQAGTYVLDGGKGRAGINLFLQHLSCSSLGAGLRRGATVRVHNVHPVYAGTRLIGLGACLRSMVQVVRFSPLGETATYRALTGGGTSLPLAMHAWRYAFNTAFLRKELPTPSRPPHHHRQHEKQGKGQKVQQQQHGVGKDPLASTASSSSSATTDGSASPPPPALSGFVTAKDLARSGTRPAVNEGKGDGLTPVTSVTATATEMEERVCKWVFGRSFRAMALPKRDVYAEFLGHPPGVCTVVDGVNGVHRVDPGSGSRVPVSCGREKFRKCCCRDERRSGRDGGNGGDSSGVRIGANAEDDAEEGANFLEQNEEVLIQPADEGWHGDSPQVPSNSSSSSSSSSSCDGDTCHAGCSASCSPLSASSSVSSSGWCRSYRSGPSSEEMLRAATRPISESLEVANQHAVESISAILSRSASCASGGGGESYRGAKRRRGSTTTAPAAAAAATRAMKNATFTVRTPFGSVAGREDGLLGWLHQEGSGSAASREGTAPATATGPATAARTVGRTAAVTTCTDDLPAAAVVEKGGPRPQVKPIPADGSSTDRGCRPPLRPGDASVPISTKKTKFSASDEAARGCGGGGGGEGAAGGVASSWLVDRTVRVKMVLLATRSSDSSWSSGAAVKVAAGPLTGVAAAGCSNANDDYSRGNRRDYGNGRDRRPEVTPEEGEGGGARAGFTLALVRKFAVCTEVVVLGPAVISSSSASSKVRRAAASAVTGPALASSSASTASAAAVASASASAGAPKAVTSSETQATQRADCPQQEDGRAHGNGGPSHGGNVIQSPPPRETISSCTYTASETLRVVGGSRVLLRSYLVVDEADMSVMPGCTGSHSDVNNIAGAGGCKSKPGRRGFENDWEEADIGRRTSHVGDADRCGRPMAHQGSGTNAAAVEDKEKTPKISQRSAAAEEDELGRRSSPSSLPRTPCPPMDERCKPPPRTSQEQRCHDDRRQQQGKQQQHLSVSEALVVRLAGSGKSSSTPSAGAGNSLDVGRAGGKRPSRGG
ncbi:unnamed protein product, partial [Scytosiphon promiscuus]